ncbi:MAG: hypothetical protein HY718_09720 [Planctomycetes bacterium]|nr:hypothetical protein [Planctomycetota bacterium]
MNLTSDIEVANTRAKLARLEARYEELQRETGGDEHVRELTMRSLKRYINQCKEDTARYEARRPVRRQSPDGGLERNMAKDGPPRNES